MQNAKSFNDYYNEISCKFLEDYCDKNKDENIVFSPYSIISLLSMIAESTAGDTNICFRKIYGIFNRNFLKKLLLGNYSQVYSVVRR